MRPASDSRLLALVGATAELHAGLPPLCSVSIRLLDRVHFTVHRGDCVLVHHNDPAGAIVLLAALAGHPALAAGRTLQGQRFSAPNVWVRRSSIRAGAIAAILDGWRDLKPSAVAQRTVPGDDTHAAVHLLRASREGHVTHEEARQWQSWARRERAHGGAVVLVAKPTGVTTEQARPPQVVAERHQWPSHHADITVSADRDTARSTMVREFVLRHGQLLNVRPWE